jgi:hypothetical protein
LCEDDARQSNPLDFQRKQAVFASLFTPTKGNSHFTPHFSPPRALFMLPCYYEYAESDHKRLKSVVRRCYKAPTAYARLWRPSADEPIGMRVLLDQPDTRGAQVYHVDPFSLAWRAGLKAGDILLALVGSDGSEQIIPSGESATQLLRPAIGDLMLRVRPRRLNREHMAASIVAAAWMGHRTRQARQCQKQKHHQHHLDVVWTQQALLGCPTGSSPIRSPPRLSFGDEWEE